MLQNSLLPRPLAAARSPWLRGTLRVPGDAAISHLALMLAASARGESIITGGLASEGIAATVRALRALGARCEAEDGRWYVSGLGISGLLEPEHAFDLGDSALGAELLMGLAGIYDFPTAFRGSPELSARSFGDVLQGLKAFGVITDSDNGRLPIKLRGPKLGMPIEHTLPANAPATKAALLLAAISAPGRSSFTEPAPTWNHAERLLRHFGANVETASGDAGHTTAITGLPNLRSRHVDVPADPSLAALAAVAASIVPGSELAVENVLVNPTRTALFSTLVAMGAGIEVRRLRDNGGEEVAELAIRHVGLKGIVLAEKHVAPLLEDLPLLAVAAAFAEGETVLNLPPRLPLWEHARIASIARGLRMNGVRCDASEDAFTIVGSPEVRGGGRVITGRDPGIAIAFLVLGMAARDQVTVDDQSGIEERFPGFADSFEDIGASFVRSASEGI